MRLFASGRDKKSKLKVRKRTMNYPEASDTQIHIHGRVKNGQLHFENLPKLREDTMFHIVTELSALVERTDVETYKSRQSKILLTAGTTICLGLNQIPPGSQSPNFSMPGIEAILEGHALLSLKGGKTEKAAGPQIYVPFVERKFSSINNAYIELSKEFEPKRRSNSYNVYKETWCFVNGTEQLLDDIRLHLMSSSELFPYKSRPFWTTVPDRGMLLGDPKFATINPNRRTGEVQVLIFSDFGSKVEILTAARFEEAVGLIQSKGIFVDYSPRLCGYGPEVSELSEQADVMAGLAI